MPLLEHTHTLTHSLHIASLEVSRRFFLLHFFAILSPSYRVHARATYTHTYTYTQTCAPAHGTHIHLKNNHMYVKRALYIDRGAERNTAPRLSDVEESAYLLRTLHTRSTIPPVFVRKLERVHKARLNETLVLTK